VFALAAVFAPKETQTVKARSRFKMNLAVSSCSRAIPSPASAGFFVSYPELLLYLWNGEKRVPS
jgi:hypothetical protein